MDEKFLLKSPTAIDLYTHMSQLPIIDYHCHLDPAAIATNMRFANITEAWLRGDHYKWRLLRAAGVPERFITGDAPDDEKFSVWCHTLEDCIGSPIYHWAHLELKRYFDYDSPVSGEKADEIYAHCNRVIAREDFNVHALLKMQRVEMLSTTDDPADSLEHHAKIRALAWVDVPQVLPSFRPSNALDIEKPSFTAYIQKLAIAAGTAIIDWESLKTALAQRIAFFAEMGCKTSDHALDPPVFCATADDTTAAQVLTKALRGESITPAESAAYKTRLMRFLGIEYHKHGWVMQFHMGAQRNNNTRMYGTIGPDTGFDSMSDASISWPLARLLNQLEEADALPRTVLYALNPIADDMLATMIGNFQGGGVRGRIQWGCPWWFNDTKTGIQKHLVTLANHGVLAYFIGMLTDSRSFLSYPRHEYFRRIMAQQLAEWADNGEFPADMMKLKKIAGDIAYYNVKEFFNM